MRYVLVLCIVFGLVLTGCSTQTAETTAVAATPKAAPIVVIIYFDGLCYGPFSGFENPASGPYPTTARIKPDLEQLAKVTKRIRIYSMLGVQSEIPMLASQLGLECIGGCWLGKLDLCNEAEIEALIKAAKLGYLKKIVVGNEVLLRKDITKDKLIGYIRRIKKETGLPVGYADTEAVWLTYPELAREVDFILVHIYAFWGGISIDNAVQHTIEKYQKMKSAFPEKEVIIGELGWPKSGETQGRAVPSLANQNKFVRTFVKKAKELSIPYYYFEAFDEEWKVTQEGGVGPAWGWQGLKREANWDQSVVDKFPFVVYNDFSALSHFIPSGWMGEINSINFDSACITRPRSGKTCIKIEWQRGGQDWSGIYWQYPENNWGDMPGYKFRGVKKLTFWARGERGGERSEFKIGGIDSNKKYRASLDLQTISVKLTNEWKKYEIMIPKENLDNVISGLCWAIAWVDNPKGATLYLDDIQFE
jgi:exo-beta-1,3-glucanase (GH17 family)